MPSTSTGPDDEGLSYAAAGVDIDAGERAVELIAPHAKRASRAEVLGGIGGFSGLFALKGNYREPVLAAASDGVGTKLAVAQAIDKHDTVGRDLVAMCVDDLVVCGAEPLFLQDYIAVGKVVPETVAQIVAGIADGCVEAGCALLGGETAEHPGLMAPDHYDISATGIGVVEADDVLGPDRVRPGDVIIAMASTGLHSNGYSLARHVLLEIDHMNLAGHVEEFGRTLGEELLEPTRIYAKDCLALAADIRIASTEAYFRAAGINNGLTASELGLSYLLPRAIGSSRAFEIMLTGRDVTAEEAERIGLVSRQVPADDLLDTCYDLAERIAAFSRPGTELTKRTLWSGLDAGSLEAHMQAEGLGPEVGQGESDPGEPAPAGEHRRRGPAQVVDPQADAGQLDEGEGSREVSDDPPRATEGRRGLR